MSTSTASTLELDQIINKDTLAADIATKYAEWKMQRSTWEGEKAEIRNYVFATDTTKTTNSKLPWKNKTTIPKLCQIRDNLHANYMAALFPNDNWLIWEAESEDGADKNKARTITEYMRNKTRQQQFRQVVSQLVLDYIDFGNSIGDVEYVKEVHTDVSGEEIVGYIGPRIMRVSALDLVFPITGASFDAVPKITRSILSLGDLANQIETRPEMKYRQEAFDKALRMRQSLSSYNADDLRKYAGLKIDGFGDAAAYIGSNLVEILEFEGDYFDLKTGTLYRGHTITIMDGCYVLRNEPMASWFGKSYKKHVGWRQRPDNILAMGPLDNLVGMQYRIDHLENLKADVFDLIAHPPMKVKGIVEDFVYAPGQRIFMDMDGDVEMMSPNVAALNANFEIQILEQKMEMYAGAPREAMGIRSPGEKTAYEVQTLQNAAGRIFQDKVTYFEENLLEPLLNCMLECARRNIDGADKIRVIDEDYGSVEFMAITKEDLTAKGKLRPVGARHFAARAQLAQNLMAGINSAAGRDPSVMAHVSGKELAKIIFEEITDLPPGSIVRDNVRVMEQVETARLSQASSDTVQEEQMVDTQPQEMVPQ